MFINLYRGSEFYRTEQVPDRRFAWHILHRRALGTAYMWSIGAQAVDACCAEERFEIDALGRYVSVNFAQLPLWVIQQEMESREEEDRRRRFDALTRMYGSTARS